MNDTLIITSTFDEHADFMTPVLESRGNAVFRFNTDSLCQYQIDFRPDLCEVRLFDKKSLKTIRISDEISVWFRRPSPDKSHDQLLDEGGIKYSRAEGKDFIKSIMFWCKSAFWISPPLSLYYNRIKTNQLCAAVDSGLRIPKTLVSQDPELVKQFWSECHGKVIAKTLKLPYVHAQNEYYVLRTKLLTETDLEKQNLYLCPLIYQERIETVFEIRIVTLGTRIFSFRHDRNSVTDVVDIRSGGLASRKCISIDLPDFIRNQIQALVKKLDASFASMDMLVDINENYYFVDLNPNGQWLWLELLTGIKISEALAHALVTKTLPQ